MNPTEQALWMRLQEYSFDDDPADALTFRARLARENRWSLAFTEYKRFAFLAAAAGHPVTPSDQVDQVWHLHLLYTRAYWEDFCPRVLGKPLHHGPTRGGADEGMKFDDWYARTRESYRRLFGAEPPADLWPEASLRFGRDAHFARINTRGNWVVPKPAVGGLLRRALGFFALAAALLAAGNAHAASVAAAPPLADWNPLEFKGEQFLRFYLMCMGAAIVAAVICRYAIWKSLSRAAARDLPPAGGQDPTLDATEIAYLAGDEPRAVEAAIVSLLQRGLLKLETDQSISQVGTVGGWPADVTALEREVHATAGGQHDINGLKRASGVSSALARVRQRLDALGLTLGKSARSQGAWTVRMILAAPLLIGGMKILVGASRGKPVGFLVMLCLLTLVVMFLFPRPALATEHGTSLLKRLRKHFGRTGSASTGLPGSGGMIRPGAECAGTLALGVGLYGASALAGSEEFAPMHRALYPPSSSGGVDSSSGGCGSSCGGGGCGGCGGGD